MIFMNHDYFLFEQFLVIITQSAKWTANHASGGIFFLGMDKLIFKEDF